MSYAISADVILLECDGCGCVAREDLLTEPLPAMPGKIGLSAGVPFSLPPPIDYAGEAQKALRGLTQHKDPETRTERLVRELICSDAFAGLSGNEHDCALWLVGMARSIEHELDHGNLPGPGTPAPILRPRDFGSDFLTPALAWAEKIGASERVREMIPFALDTAILFGALEAITGNESLSDVVKLDAAYADKIQRLSRWVMP
jgi:hypothetical protein